MSALASAPFRFDYGRISLDLVSTVRRRQSSGIDLLTRPDDAARWLRAAQLVAGDVNPTEAQFRRLIHLREAVYALCKAALSGKRPGEADIAIINNTAARASERLELDGQWRLHVRTVNLVELAIARVAKDAAQMLGSPETRELLRGCEQDDCGTLFIDASPGRRRRWCSMTRCGSRAKAKAFRKRHLQAT
jgi:predicted RNA-binding Zn ribbon-like protein